MVEAPLEHESDSDILSRKIDELAKKCSRMERAAAEMCALSGLSPRQAMLEAGYSKVTVNKRGPAFVMDRPHVVEYIKALKEGKKESLVGGLKARLVGLEHSLGIAIRTLTELAQEADSDSVRVRAAGKLLDLGKGIIIASMPQAKVDATALMKEIYEEAVAARKAHEDQDKPLEEYLDVEADGDDASDSNAGAEGCSQADS